MEYSSHPWYSVPTILGTRTSVLSTLTKSRTFRVDPGTRFQ